MSAVNAMSLLARSRAEDGVGVASIARAAWGLRIRLVESSCVAMSMGFSVWQKDLSTLCILERFRNVFNLFLYLFVDDLIFTVIRCYAQTLHLRREVVNSFSVALGLGKEGRERSNDDIL